MDTKKYSNILVKNECEQILENALTCKKYDLNLVDFKLVPVSSDIIGFLGEYFHLVINAKRSNCENVTRYDYFVKSVPVSNELHTKIIKDYNVFPKETSLYATLFREMKAYRTAKWHVECYYVRPDILVMEDLSKQSYRHLAVDEEFSLEHLKLTLQSAAAMHANSIIFEEKTGINIGQKYQEILTEISVSTNSGWLNAGLKVIQAISLVRPQAQSEDVRTFMSQEFMKLKDKMIEIIQPSTEFRSTLCHRDIWEKNLLFKYDENDPHLPKQCIPVDFQHTQYNPPALDVLTIIYLNSNRKLRDSHLDQLLEFYYNCLDDHLRSADIDIRRQLAWDEFQKSCAYVKLLPVILSGIYCQLEKLPDGFMNDLKITDPELYKQYVTVDRIDFIFERMQIDKNYKGYILECVDEIIEPDHSKMYATVAFVLDFNNLQFQQELHWQKIEGVHSGINRISQRGMVQLHLEQLNSLRTLLTKTLIIYSCPPVTIKSSDIARTSFQLRVLQSKHILDTYTLFQFCKHLPGCQFDQAKVLSYLEMSHNNYSKILVKQECLKILAQIVDCKNNDLNLVKFDIVPISKDVVGFFGEYFILIIYGGKINDQQHGKHECFVKSAPVSSETHSRIVKSLDVFPKEMILYSDLFRKMNKYNTFKKWHPLCYYSREDILVMENLSNQDYRTLFEEEQFSKDHIKLALQCAAAMHANSIIYEEKTGVSIGDEYPCLLREIIATEKSAWMKAGFEALQAVINCTPELQDKNVTWDDLLQLKNKFIEVAKPSTQFRNVFSNRDLWKKNILFKYDKRNSDEVVDCLFVDYQIAKYIPPAVDVLLIVYLNANSEIRKNCIEELIAFYYNCLRNFVETSNLDMESILTWDEFSQSCKCLRIFPIVLRSLYAQLGNVPDEEFNKIRNETPDLFQYYMEVNRVNLILEQMRKSEMYKQEIIESIKEVIDFV